MKLTGLASFVGIFAFTILTACGGGGDTSSVSDSNSSADTQPAGEMIEIIASGIKGPLAFADAKVFKLDSSYPGFYNEIAPIATAITDQYAQIHGLSVPRKIKPPYVLTIGGNQAIDLNTGKPPVISTLITVITQEMLTAKRAIYATLLTTLSFDMARHEVASQPDVESFMNALGTAASLINDNFAIHKAHVIDIFHSPLMITDATRTLEEQEEAVYHRAAIEAFAAKVHLMTSQGGDGLHAVYYSDPNLSQQALSLTDSSINFTWNQNGPDSSVNPDGFSARWSGFVEPNYSENYTFYTSSDDGVRLWVDGQLLVDQWSDHAETEYSATMQLSAGRKYPILMEYYESQGNAVAKLLWSSASQTKSIVPQANLYNATSTALLEDIDSDTLIDRVALDLQSDAIIDNAADGEVIGGVNPQILLQNAVNLQIPNTAYIVEDIVALMEEERTYLGDKNGPELLVGAMTLETSAEETDPIPVPTTPPASPNIVLSASQMDFGGVDVGSMSDIRTVVMDNVGNAPLNITNISIPSNFVETHDCSNYLPDGTSCAFNVRFIPTEGGATQGALQIDGDDGNSYVIALTGTGNNVVPPADSSNSATSLCGQLDTIFCIDHNNVAAGHIVTDQDITNWFLANQSKAGIINGGAIDIVADPSGDPERGNVMRVFQKEGTLGFDGPSGGQWRSWPGNHEELYFAYDYYMEPGRMWSKGQKLPGLMGGDWAAGSGGSNGGLPDGTNGFSARLMMFSTQAYPGKGDGALGQYTYYTDKVQVVKWYDDGPDGQVNLERGRWYRIETRVKLNTPGQSNGVMQAWVDGVQVLNSTSVNWRTTSDLKLDGVYFLFGYGGNESSWYAPEDQRNYYDNWVLSTKPITH